jgi:uncharacterized protein YbjQ (UPF0145 family)
LLLLTAFFIGEWLEKSHYKSIRQREELTKGLVVVNVKRVPVEPGWEHDRSGLVTGHVVISVDYFKRFTATLRSVFGGRIRSYESLLDRARREAILRMKKQAMDEGYQAVINLRLETSAIAKSSKNNKKVAGVEVLAFGTGIKMVKVAA